ncbi:MAG: aminoacyl-tRNA hydrolase [Bacillota bacterium]
MHLIVGLGNPSKKYEGSRHNLGFMVVEKLSCVLQAGKPLQKHHSLFTISSYEGKKVLLAQPLTYMNRSGLAVSELLRYYKFSPEELLVICDDLDLPPGVIRLKGRGGSAGHRGIQSIIHSLGTSDFARLRIGIGKPPPFMETPDYVLQPVTGPEKELTENALERSVDAVLAFVRDGLEAAMNLYNQPAS